MAWFRFLFFTTAIVVSALLIVGACWVGYQIPFAQQWPLYEALRNTAAIIFAVVGAWLAIIYPERLKLSFGKKAEDKSSSTNLRVLLAPAVHSTIILVVLLAVGVAAPIIKRIPYAIAHVEVFRGISFVLLALLTIWQIAIVVVAIVPIELLLNQATDDDARKKLADHYGSRHQRL